MQKFLGELKSQGELIFSEPCDIGSELAFSVNETKSFHEKCQNESFVLDLGK